MDVILEISITVDNEIARYNATELAKEKLRNDIYKAIKTETLESYINRTFYTHIYEPPEPETNYRDEAEDDAKELIQDYFLDEIIQQLIDDGEASDDYNNNYDNGDGIFHENVVDRYYDPEDALKLINQLRDYEEDDSGLWEGQDYEKILGTKAAYTYGNVVYHYWAGFIEEINEIDLEELDIEIANTIKKVITEGTIEPLREKIKQTENMSNEELVEWIKENMTNTYRTTMEIKLKEEIKEILVA